MIGVDLDKIMKPVADLGQQFAGIPAAIERAGELIAAAVLTAGQPLAYQAGLVTVTDANEAAKKKQSTTKQ